MYRPPAEYKATSQIESRTDDDLLEEDRKLGPVQKPLIEWIDRQRPYPMFRLFTGFCCLVVWIVGTFFR